MSDNSMAFLAGGAFAGIAVLLLLKGGVNPSQANLQPIVQQSPLAVQSTANMPPGIVPGSPYAGSYSDQQRLMDERLKTQIEQQRSETEQLKAQVRNQQMIIESLTSQTQANVLTQQSRPAPQALASAEQSANNPLFTGVIWAVGGAVVTLGGGIFLVGILALFSQQQRSRRTVQVIHPINSYQPSLQSRRRSEFLPPRIVESKRVEEIELDER